MNETKLTRDEGVQLFIRFRKENPVFEDLVSERDKIVGVMEFHTISLDSLKTELKNWDNRVEQLFKKLVNKERKNLEKSKKNQRAGN